MGKVILGKVILGKVVVKRVLFVMFVKIVIGIVIDCLFVLFIYYEYTYRCCMFVCMYYDFIIY